LRERAAEYFEFEESDESPYMLLVTPVHPSQRVEIDEGAKATRGMAALKVKRSSIPAVTHVDGSARVQTVDEERHGRYYRLLKAFEKRTGCGLVVNTSFNVRGEPIVCTPADAWHCFMVTDMDVLVLENCVLRKEDQPEAAHVDREEHLSRFELD
jgi:carbamoyltransferase